MWDMRRTVPVAEWPRTRTTVAFRFDDVPARVGRWWMVTSDDDVDVCDFDPGYEVTATVHTRLRTLTEIWRGDVSWQRAIGSGALTIEGPAGVRRALPAWMGQGSFATVERIA
jgi:hypothetical protein